MEKVNYYTLSKSKYYTKLKVKYVISYNFLGFAEMAVTRFASMGFETPMSEHAFDINRDTETWTAEQRRMSDTNIFSKFAYKRSAVTPGPGPNNGLQFNYPNSKRVQSSNSEADFDCRSVACK